MNNINVADLTTYLNTLIPDITHTFHYALFDIESSKVLPGCSYCEASIEGFIDSIKEAGSVTAHLVLNETDGRGRKIENILGVRAFLVDLDREIEPGTLHNLIFDYKPLMVVESSPKKYHFYWPIPQGFHEKYKNSFRLRWLAIQRSMAFKMNGDTQCSLSRLIRMPGIKRVCKDGSEFIPHIEYCPENCDPVLNITKLKHAKDSRTVRKKERQRVLNISDKLFPGWEVKNGLGTPDKTLQFSPLELSLDIPKGMRNSTLYEVLREGVYRGVANSQKELLVIAKKINAEIKEESGGPLLNDELKKIVESAFIRGSKGRSRSEKGKEVERVKMEEGLGTWEWDVETQDVVLMVKKNLNGHHDTLPSTPSNNSPSGEQCSDSLRLSSHLASLSLINTIEPFSSLAIVQSVIVKNFDRIIRVIGEGVMCFNDKEGVWVLQGSKDGNIELTEMLREEIERIVLSAEFKGFYGVGKDGEPNLKMLAKERERLRSVKNESAFIKSIKESSEIRKVDRSQFDRVEHVIKCKNGVLDMLTGQIRKATPQDYIMRYVDIDWLSSSFECPRWLTFINQIFAKNKNPTEMVNFMQMVFGYTISGSIQMQTVFCHIGTGSNGKSTVMSALKKLSGMYGTKLGPQTLNKKNIENFERLGAKIAGFRCVIIDDIETGSTWNESFLKNLTDGEIETRRLFNEAKVLKNYAKVHMGLNEFPKPETESEAFFRRVTLIPYDNVFIPNNQKAAELDLMLKSVSDGGELEAILAWSVEGYQKFSAITGFKEIRPQEVDMENRLYQESMSPIETFLKQFLREMNEEELSQIGEVSDAYKGLQGKEILDDLRKWARENEVKVDINPVTLGKHIKKVFRVISAPIWHNGQVHRFFPLVWTQRVESQELMF